MQQVLILLVIALLVSCRTATPVPAPTPTPVKLDVDAGQCATPARLDTDLTNASQAAVISLSGVSPLNCPEVSMSNTWAGGKLVFSDSPESPTSKGKLYEDTSLPATSGTDYNRVFLYHVNGRSTTSRFTVLLKNTSQSQGTLTVQKKGIAGPTTSYLYAGKLAFERWLNSTAGSGVNVAAGATVRLDSIFDVTNVSQNNLLHGIWDYSFGQTHQITICMLDTGDNPLNVCPGLSVLSRDSHQRGTFPYADKVYDSASGVTIDSNNGVQQFPIAGGTTNDPNAVGTDATDSSSMTLAGNYGILYRMHLNLASTDGQNLGFLFNPRAGQWGGAVWALAGLTTGGKFLIPASSGSTGDNTKGAVEAKYNPASTSAVWLQFMPTGGSAFPLRFVIVPH